MYLIPCIINDKPYCINYGKILYYKVCDFLNRYQNEVVESNV